jgi:hypothetical protein
MRTRRAPRLAWGILAGMVLLMVAVQIMSVSFGLGTDPFLFATLSFPVVGALIISRQPDNRIGWIMLATGFVWTLIAVLAAYAYYGLHHPGSLPRPDIVQAVAEPLWVPAVGLMGTFLILMFPDGRLPSPRWRPWARFCTFTLVALYLLTLIAPVSFAESGYPDVQNPLGIQALKPIINTGFYLVLLLPIAMVGCAVGLVQRFRRSRGEERLQMKWFVGAAGLAATSYFVALMTAFILSFRGEAPAWIEQLILTFFLIPIAIGVAILKYRLYDIDVIINRALVYGALTGTLSIFYFLIVTVLQNVLRPFSGQSQIAVAGSTLAVAALFRPARVRIQELIDRRFYRRKYDAERTLDAFSTRLKDEMDLDALTEELVAVVGGVMQPRQVSLWLKEND